MMKILHINTWYGKGGAAKSVMELSRLLSQQEGVRSDILSGFVYGEKSEGVLLLNHTYERYINAFITRFTGYDSLWYPFSKKKKLKKIVEQYDIIHLHNIHGYYFMLDYLDILKEKPVVWTLRDFWPITGGCAVIRDCYKWKTGCGDCPHLEYYPKSIFFDRTAQMFKKKCEYIHKLTDLKIVTISKWANEIIKQSHLGGFDTSLIYEGLDTNVYTIRDTFVDKNNNRTSLLFIANKLTDKTKGLLHFLEGLKLLQEKEKYEIIFVGEKMPKSVKNTHLRGFVYKEYGYVSNPEEMSYLYSVADLFINLSMSETFGRTNVEAMLSGTPVLAYDIPIMREIIGDKGIFVPLGNIVKLANTIDQFRRSKSKMVFYDRNDLRNYALRFSDKKMCKKYIKLYTSMLT